MPTPFPATESLLCYFAAYLAQYGLAPASIKVYLAAVRHMQVLLGLPEPQAVSSLPRLKLVLNGIARGRAYTGSPQKPRLPIMIHVLKKLFTTLKQRTPSFDNCMLWAACSLCFFGFFRAGEITVPSKTSFNPNHHLAWGDVSADCASKPSCIRVHLKVLKCDQFGKGVDVFLGVTGCPLCPVTACSAYIAVRGPTAGPFFIQMDGTPLSKGAFVQQVKALVSDVGLDASLYSGHSFRIGAATSAAQAGIQDSTIQALGRWSSGAFLTYVRTPRSQLAGLSRELAGTL